MISLLSIKFAFSHNNVAGIVFTYFRIDTGVVCQMVIRFFVYFMYFYLSILNCNLRSLQLFTEYGRLALEESNSKPFQVGSLIKQLFHRNRGFMLFILWFRDMNVFAFLLTL